MGLDLLYIDGQTPIDEDEKNGLLIKTISTRSELDEFEQYNIEKAVQWTLQNKFKLEKILREDFILELHRRMYNEVWKWAGQFRKTNKNIGLDKFQIAFELRNLLDDCKYWIKNKFFTEDEISIRFKHRLVQIHLFSNGNGRHSRLCADVFITQIFNKPIFTWGNSNLVKPGLARKKYMEAIHSADKSDIKPLITFARS
jgi:Fic-DOC domain mobile mystery protein B